MLSDFKTAQTECLFLLIDNDIIVDNMFEQLMNNLMKNEYECYVYLNWLLTRWVYLRKNKFQIPEKKKIFSVLIAEVVYQYHIIIVVIVEQKKLIKI